MAEAKLPLDKAEANSLITGGLGLGAFGAASAALFGAVCPICVVAAPALVGAGIYKRYCARDRTYPSTDPETNKP
jgi:hypothetical protein